MKKAIVLILILLVPIVFLAFFLQKSYLRTQEPYMGFSGETTVTIDSGASAQRISRRLADAGVISDSRLFYWYFRLAFRGDTLKAGEYSFDEPLSMKQVIELLVSGRGILYRITFQEGLTIREMGRLVESVLPLSAAEFAAAAADTELIADLDQEASDLEGYLFPDTYLVGKQLSARSLVGMMVANFRRNFSQNLVWRAHDIGFSMRKTVILASLIEKETAAREERFLISSVFHNRLRRNMRLDCDPTVIYALERDGVYRGRLGWDELKYPSPYNTRLYAGLPPGPIANPGLASIEAALFPESTDYFYFVKKDANTHYFSKNLAEHNAAVRKYILKRAP